MKFEGITPEIVWANKEAIFLIAIVLGFALLLVNFKSRDKTHVGVATITQTHLEGRERTRVYTISVRKKGDPPNRVLFYRQIKGTSMPELQGKRTGTPFFIKYRKAPDGSWMITDIER